MNSQIQMMLDKYNCQNTEQYENALKEIIQEIALCGLSRAGFFNEACFCGGTALRIFHGIERFSEDLDFSLISPNEEFRIERYFRSVEDELNSFGFEMDIEKKDKKQSSVQSAFLKGNTLKLLMEIAPVNPPVFQVMSTKKTRIKLEIDVNPPTGATCDMKYALLPAPYEVRLYDLPSMFSGKLHAILCREYVKGRDLYDYIWYLRHGVQWNQELLRNSLIQTGHLPEGVGFGPKDARHMLLERFTEIDFSEAKKDVLPFVRDGRALDIWSEDFFMKCAHMVQIE